MIYFTSDTHYGHRNIIKLCNRPFENIFEMQNTMIRNWNEVVSDTDTVVHVGDFAMRLSDIEICGILEQLKGYKILIRGNHDRGTARMLQVGFNLVLNEMRFMYESIQFLVSHYPYRNNSIEDQNHVHNRPKDRGEWLIHGHVHDKWKKKYRQLNMSVEVWDYTPASIDQIIELVQS